MNEWSITPYGVYNHHNYLNKIYMYSNIFEEIGLSPNEAKIYETLLSTGETSISQIAIKGKIHRRNVYDAINRLVEKGLVFQIFQKNENMYRAVNPKKLIEIIKEKEEKLNNILPNLKKLFDQKPSEEIAYAYKGIEGYKNYHNDILRVKKEVYFLGAKALWLSPQVQKTKYENFIEVLEKEQIPFKMLFDPRVKKKLPQLAQYRYGEYKFLPNEYETPAVVDIFGDYIVNFTSIDIGQVDENSSFLIIKNKKMAESYKTWFKFIWERCPSIK